MKYTPSDEIVFMERPRLILESQELSMRGHIIRAPSDLKLQKE